MKICFYHFDVVTFDAKYFSVIECIFLSQGRHYDSFPDFTPSSDASWCLKYKLFS